MASGKRPACVCIKLFAEYSHRNSVLRESGLVVDSDSVNRWQFIDSVIASEYLDCCQLIDALNEDMAEVGARGYYCSY